MDFLIKNLYDSLYFAGPIILCTLGGLFAYKANVINIGLEGMMLFGGFIAALIIFFTGNWWFGLSASIFLGILLGLLFSYFGITKKANFIITGFAINLLALAVGKYVLALLGDTNINVISVPGIQERAKIDLWLIKDIPLIGEILSGHPLMTYVAIISVFVVAIILYHTKFGIYVRVVGENEEAAKSVGINNHRIQYLAIIIGGILCGLAGFNVAIEQLASYTPQITAGTGFIAIAAIFCGNGDPKRSSLYALLFGVSRALSVNLALKIGSIAGLLEIIPYLTIILVLTTVALLRQRQSLLRGLSYE
jgi:general nucleoside transport system permease protein